MVAELHLLKDTEEITYRKGNMEIKELVLKYLYEIPQTRSNDNLLIAYVIRDMYGIQNTFDIALSTTSNIYETIRRCRARVQNEENPMLKPAEVVVKARKKKEEEIKEYLRGI